MDSPIHPGRAGHQSYQRHHQLAATPAVAAPQVPHRLEQRLPPGHPLRPLLRLDSTLRGLTDSPVKVRRIELNSTRVGRRNFLGAVAAAPFLSVFQQRSEPLNPLGLQLSTIRSDLDRQFERTLERVSVMGYREVEFYGYHGRSPQHVKDVLKANGLVGVSAHTGWNTLGDGWKEVVDTAVRVGHNHLVINAMGPPLPPREIGVWSRGADQLNRAGEVCKAAGLRLAYHNHLFEFFPFLGDSRRPYDVLMEATDPALVAMQMDLCWTVAAGEDPLQYFRRYPGRYLSVHVKDIKRLPAKQPDGSFVSVYSLYPDLCPVGQGLLDWARLLDACKRAGIRHYFVEQDEPSAPMDSADASAKYLRGVRLG